MEYPPSYKERDLVDPPNEFENPKPQPPPKETPNLPNFGNKVPPKPEKPIGFVIIFKLFSFFKKEFKNLQGNIRKNNNSNDNDFNNASTNQAIPKQISSSKVKNMNIKKKKNGV